MSERKWAGGNERTEIREQVDMRGDTKTAFH